MAPATTQTLMRRPPAPAIRPLFIHAWARGSCPSLARRQPPDGCGQHDHGREGDPEPLSDSKNAISKFMPSTPVVTASVPIRTVRRVSVRIVRLVSSAVRLLNNSKQSMTRSRLSSTTSIARSYFPSSAAKCLRRSPSSAGLKSGLASVEKTMRCRARRLRSWAVARTAA